MYCIAVYPFRDRIPSKSILKTHTTISPITMPNQPLAPQQLDQLQCMSTSIRRTIIQMLDQSQSGHTGGSLGMADIFATLYGVVHTERDKVVVSNGHLSPVVYATLAEMGYVDKQEVIAGFRRDGSIFEGHITRHVAGIEYGTGPLGIGVSVASSFALAKKKRGESGTVFCTMGDGEFQEGQVHEMMHFSAKYKLDNLIIIVDQNNIQLSGAIQDIMPVDIAASFAAAGFEVMECDGHSYQELWHTIGELQDHGSNGKPKVIMAHTIMGKGVSFMEKEAEEGRSTWHGKAPSHEEANAALEELDIIRCSSHANPRDPKPTLPSKVPHPDKEKANINQGTPITYPAGTVIDCRSAYGNALLDLAKHNNSILALTADLGGSVKMDGVQRECPEQYIECGIAEQHMISTAGGLSLDGYIPFVSTFGAFITSRAKDQARVNDINRTNVKMVATHCGLSVGEDGPTHQAIDDMGSFLGLFNTGVLEPADANQCDHMVRYIASHYGNFYMRMGRHKFPVLTHESGELVYGPHYQYTYGKSDVVRVGTDVTIAATGACVYEAVVAWEALKQEGISAEVVAVSSIKQLDEVILTSVKKTSRVVTVEDHHTKSGLGGMLASALLQHGVEVAAMTMLGVSEYQLSGTAGELYHRVGIDGQGIAAAVKEIL